MAAGRARSPTGPGSRRPPASRKWPPVGVGLSLRHDQCGDQVQPGRGRRRWCDPRPVPGRRGPLVAAVGEDKVDRGWPVRVVPRVPRSRPPAGLAAAGSFIDFIQPESQASLDLVATRIGQQPSQRVLRAGRTRKRRSSRESARMAALFGPSPCHLTSARSSERSAVDQLADESSAGSCRSSGVASSNRRALAISTRTSFWCSSRVRGPGGQVLVACGA